MAFVLPLMRQNGYEMKKTESLKKNYEFARVYKKGNRYRSKNLSLYVLKDNRKKKRIGITVSKKAYGRSVDRNRIRRLVRESYRSFEKQINGNPNMVFVVRKNNEVPPFSIIKEEVQDLLQQSGLM